MFPGQNVGGTYRDDSRIIRVQLNTIHWEGGVQLLLEGLDGWVNPWGVAQERELHDSSNEVVPETITDGGWEIPNANRTLNTILVRVGARQGRNL